MNKMRGVLQRMREIGPYSAPQDSDWFSVEDRLPPEETPVLCTRYRSTLPEEEQETAFAQPFLAQRKYGQWYECEMPGLPTDVSHWMLLPDLPEQG